MLNINSNKNHTNQEMTSTIKYVNAKLANTNINRTQKQHNNH